MYHAGYAEMNRRGQKKMFYFQNVNNFSSSLLGPF